MTSQHADWPPLAHKGANGMCLWVSSRIIRPQLDESYLVAELTAGAVNGPFPKTTIDNVNGPTGAI